MSQTSVKESICNICGVDVRDGSLFCYNCGSSVTASAGQDEMQTEATELQSPGAKSNGIPKNDDFAKQLPGSRTRRRKRPVQNREVVWAEREGMSLSFVVTTFILVLLTAAILIAGFYFR